MTLTATDGLPLSSCRFCGMRCIWATTISGRKVPMNPEASWRGRYILEQGRDGQVFAKVVSGRATEPNRFTLHLVTCPANQKAGPA